jgi:Zn-dependent M28 family amino/carboxypeptidase
LRAEINQTLKPAVFELKDVDVRSTVEREKPLETENVLAFIEGSDPKLKDETVVISAHYDHLGTDPNLKGDQIYNGAADDGSGTVATLELAKAFAEARRDGFAPRRSILFVNFAGEEKGILGSSYYAYSSPVVPLEKTVANINMDGVGGIDPQHPTASKNYIYLATPEKISDNLLEINTRVHKLTGSSLELTNGNGKGFSSDDQSFSNLLVPSIYYSTGRTEHYHAPGDAPETIDYEHLARVTQLIFAAAWQIANQTEKVSSLDRSKFKQVGYICPPCPFGCDKAIHDRAGVCPVCGMNLMPHYAARTD